MDCIQGISFYQDEYNNVWVTRRSKNAVFVKVKSDSSAFKNRRRDICVEYYPLPFLVHVYIAVSFPYLYVMTLALCSTTWCLTAGSGFPISEASLKTLTLSLKMSLIEYGAFPALDLRIGQKKRWSLTLQTLRICHEERAIHRWNSSLGLSFSGQLSLSGRTHQKRRTS